MLASNKKATLRGFFRLAARASSALIWHGQSTIVFELTLSASGFIHNSLCDITLIGNQQ